MRNMRCNRLKVGLSFFRIEYSGESQDRFLSIIKLYKGVVVMAENIILNVDRKYRDTVFRILFGEDKKNAMSLYEAISGKKIRNPEDFEFTTL